MMIALPIWKCDYDDSILNWKCDYDDSILNWKCDYDELYPTKTCYYQCNCLFLTNNFNDMLVLDLTSALIIMHQVSFSAISSPHSRI